MKVTILILLLMLCSPAGAQNNLRISFNNKAQHAVDTSEIAKERLANAEKFNRLIEKINTLESKITDNKKEFYDSIVNIYSFVAIAITIILSIFTFFGLRSINQRFNDYKNEMTNFEKIKSDLKTHIDEELSAKVDKSVSTLTKSFYQKPIEDLNEKFTQMSILLDTIKGVFEIRNHKPLFPEAYRTPPVRRYEDDNAFDGGANG